jgi:hypothetical protein
MSVRTVIRPRGHRSGDVRRAVQPVARDPLARGVCWRRIRLEKAEALGQVFGEDYDLTKYPSQIGIHDGVR